MIDVMNTPFVFMGESVNVCEGVIQVPNLLLQDRRWTNRWNDFRFENKLFLGEWKHNDVFDFWLFQSNEEELLRLYNTLDNR